MDVFAEFIDLDDPSFAEFCVNDGDIVGNGRAPKGTPLSGSFNRFPHASYSYSPTSVPLIS